MNGKPSRKSAYKIIHQQLTKERGPARDHLCACGSRAFQWAYRYTGNPEYRDPEGGFPFSENMDDYAPMCRSCHIRLDMEEKGGVQPNNTSGIRGVSWHRGTGKWRVHVKYRGKTYSGGYFRYADLDKAEQAAIALRERVFSEGVKA